MAPGKRKTSDRGDTAPASAESEPRTELNRSAKEWFDTLAESTFIAVAVSREKFLFLNRACEILTGYSAQELLQMDFWEVVHPQDAEFVRQRGAARLRGEVVPSRYELRIRTKDGQERWIDMSAALIQFRGAPAVLSTSVDITERKLADLALRESEEKYRLIVENQSDLVAKVDPTGVLTFASPSFYRFFHLQENRSLGRSILPMLPERERRVAEELLRRLASPPHEEQVEHRFQLEGSEHWLSWLCGGVIDEMGKIKEVVAVGRDITAQKRSEQALRESEEEYRGLFENAHDAILILSPEDEVILDVNPRACELYGFNRDELIGMSTRKISQDPERGKLHVAETLRKRDHHHFESVQFRKDGTRMYLEINAAVVSYQGQQAILSINRDITKRKRAEEALQREKELAQVTLASIGDGVIRVDPMGRVDYLNPVAEKLTGQTATHAIGSPLVRVLTIVDENTRQPLIDPVERCLRQGRIVDLPPHCLLIRRDGSEFSIRGSAAPVRDHSDSVIGAVLVIKDVTQLRGMEREMTYLATHDHLTGLVNRREFERRLEQALLSSREEKRSHALCYIDLDRFKVVNDSCGHTAGDNMLRQISELLKTRVRTSDVLARLGGDEFGVLLNDCPITNAREIAESLRREVEEYRFVWGGRVFETGASIGLVPIQLDSGGLAELLSAADSACYVAKEKGRNLIHEYEPGDMESGTRSGPKHWTTRLQKALAENRFTLYHQLIQPLHAGAGGQPLHEVLLRMRSEEDELIPPAVFIPAAERFHLAPSLDRWVVRRVLDAVAQGELTAPVKADTRLAINLSAQSLGDDAFLEYILKELERSGVDPNRLLFEISETTAVANQARASTFFEALQRTGCRFVLDNFGSGLSSFAFLKDLPVDFLKIDGAFIKEMESEPVHEAFVRSIQQIAKVLGIATIAEWVESEALFQAVQRLGLDYAQGYWIGEPRPLTEDNDG